MGFIGLKTPGAWGSIDAGIEGIGDILGLAVGGGALGVNAITGAIPAAPWAANGGLPPSSIYEGNLLVIDDNSVVDHLYYEILPPNWTADLGSAGSGGFTCHMKLVARENFNPWENAKIVFDDGTDRFFFEFRAGGTVHDQNGAIVGDNKLEMELYVSIQNGVMKFWQWNPETLFWSPLNLASASVAGVTDHIAFGSFDDPTVGKGSFYFLRYKESYQATPFFSTSPKATMGEISGGGAIITQNPITESTATGSAVSYKYDLNQAGFSAAKTLAQLTADLVGQPLFFLNLEVTFPSDGVATSSIDLNGGVLAGSTIRRKFERFKT